VRDRAFTGRDVAEAVQAAAQALGLPADKLRYFVLEPGRPATVGVAPSPARIAVLMDAGPAPRRRDEDEDLAPALPAHGVEDAVAGEDEDEDLESRLRRVTTALAEAAGFAIDASIREDRDAVTLHLQTADPGFFLGEDGEGAPQRALEHLFHRMFSFVVHPLKLRLEIEGYREARDEALRRQALRLVDDVRRTGEPRQTGPLNAYERRIVHLAVAASGGVASRSEGEGAARRVVVSRSEDQGPGGEVH
jgi:spoIIIJ-associated protein